MPTGQTIVNGALTTLGLLEQGGTPSTSDSVDSLTELNIAWGAWGIDEGLIYSVQKVSQALTTAIPSYTIGTGAAFNVPRPGRIYRAYLTLGANRNELDVVEAARYYSHNDLTASAATPDELYPDYNVDGSGFGTLYLWPVPAFTGTAPSLELEVGVNFAAWTLGANYQIPQGYQDAIEKALAFRLIPRFGAAVAPEVVQAVTMLAQKAEARIRAANAFNRKLPAEAASGPTPPAKAQ